jgi:hypothetical protein
VSWEVKRRMVNASDVEAQVMGMVGNRKRMEREYGRQCKPTVNWGRYILWVRLLGPLGLGV